MNPAPTVPLDQLSVDQQNKYINDIVDDPHTTVRKADSYLLRRLHTLALERFDNCRRRRREQLASTLA